MNKKKKSTKRKILWRDIEESDIDISKLKDLKEVYPENFYKNDVKVASALLGCLIDNDPHGYMEILDEYLKINRSKVAHSARIVHYSATQEMPEMKID